MGVYCADLGEDDGAFARDSTTFECGAKSIIINGNCLRCALGNRCEDTSIVEFDRTVTTADHHRVPDTCSQVLSSDGSPTQPLAERNPPTALVESPPQSRTFKSGLNVSETGSNSGSRRFDQLLSDGPHAVVCTDSALAFEPSNGNL